MMHRYIFEDLDRAGLYRIDAEVQALYAAGVNICTQSIVSRDRLRLHAIEIVTYSDDPRVAAFVTENGGREVTQ